MNKDEYFIEQKRKDLIHPTPELPYVIAKRYFDLGYEVGKIK